MTATATRSKVIPKASEDDIQVAIMQALEHCGFTVLSTSAHRQKESSGVSLGIPDLLVWHPIIGGSCLGLEVKRSEKARRRPDQIRMVKLGHYRFVWTVEMALDAVAQWMRTYYRFADIDRTITMQRIQSMISQLQGGSKR